jgi:hypothetical protein
LIYFRIRIEVLIKTKMSEDSLNLLITSLADVPADIALIQLNQYLGHEIQENKKIHRINIKTLVNKFPISWCKKDENKYLAPTFKKGAYIEYLTSIANGYKIFKNPDYSPRFQLSQIPDFDENWVRITVEEFREVVMNRNTNGKDMYNLSYDKLKTVVDSVADFVVSKYNEIIDGDGDLCDEWCSSNIHTAFKGGNPEEINRFRPISVLPIIVRIMDCILASKLHAILIQYNIIDTRVQKAILRNSSGLWENIFDVNFKMCKMMDKEDTSKIFFFIDLANAFGNVNYGTMLHILEAHNFSPKFSAYFHRYYTNICGFYRKRKFKWNNGLFQGSALSLILFIVYIDYILKHMFRDMKMSGAVQLEYDLQENTYAFVDDIVMILENDDKNEARLDVMNRIFEVYGMKINCDKTYFMMYDQTIQIIRYANGVEYNRAGNDFLYLGQHLFVYSDHIFSNIMENLLRCLEKIDRLTLSPEIKIYIYYSKIFLRITRVIEIHYLIRGNHPNIQQIIQMITHYLTKWSIPAEFMKKHLEYLGQKGGAKIAKSPNLRKYMLELNIQESIIEEKALEYEDIFGQSTPEYESVDENLQFLMKNQRDEFYNDFYSTI